MYSYLINKNNIANNIYCHLNDILVFYIFLTFFHSEQEQKGG